MDSDHSSSFQSSSGGDNEYDLRAVFPSENNPSVTNLPPPALPTSMLLQPDLHWPGSTRTEPGFGYPVHTGASQARPAPSALDFTNPTPARNPRKRSRASRRAPTTVLTTDTSNFRAMVQQFTGIPSFPRTTYSILDTVSSPNNNRRPFTQKFQFPAAPFLSYSHSLHPLISNAKDTNSNPICLNFKHPIPQNLPSPLTNTHLQPNPKSVFANLPAPETHPPEFLGEIKFEGLDQFCLSSVGNHVNGSFLPNLSPSDLDRENWRNSELKQSELETFQGQFMPIDGGKFSTQSDFHGANLGNVGLPGEGTTE